MQKSPANSLKTLIPLSNYCKYMIMKTLVLFAKIIGTRHDEKDYEVLLSRRRVEECVRGKYFRVPPDIRDLTMKRNW